MAGCLLGQENESAVRFTPSRPGGWGGARRPHHEPAYRARRRVSAPPSASWLHSFTKNGDVFCYEHAVLAEAHRRIEGGIPERTTASQFEGK